MTFNFDLPKNLAVGFFVSKNTSFSLISIGTGNSECSKKMFSRKIKLYYKCYERNAK